jgi:hypothetical protein
MHAQLVRKQNGRSIGLETLMPDVVIFRYRGYDMHCGARALDNGKFAPTLSILKQVWPSRPKEISVPRGDHATAAEATQVAHDMGIEWIDNYG